jgi:type VI secretion system secreted protein Hcp
MKRLLHLSAFALACLLLGVGSRALASMDLFLRLTSATGESVDPAHAQDIELLSWQWGAANSSTTHVGGAAAGKPTFQNLSLSKFVDRSTPVLMSAVAKGTHIERAILYVRATGPRPVEFYKVVCENLLVTSVQLGGHRSEDRLTEQVILNVQKIGVEYVRIDAQGLPAAPERFSWDILAGTPAGLSFSDPVDFDEDGLPDTWERAYGTQPNVRDGDADLDRDGATNLEEYLAGTDPSKTNSVFIAKLDSPTNLGVATLSWNSVSGRVYRVLVSDRPEGEFQLLQTVPSAGNGTTSVLVGANLARKFFRVEALPGL